MVAQKLELEQVREENSELHKKLSAAEKTASNAADLHQKLEQLAAVQNELTQSKSEVANL